MPSPSQQKPITRLKQGKAGGHPREHVLLLIFTLTTDHTLQQSSAHTPKRTTAMRTTLIFFQLRLVCEMFLILILIAFSHALVCPVDEHTCSAERVAGIHYLDGDCPVKQCDTSYWRRHLCCPMLYSEQRDPACPASKPFCTGDRCIECFGHRHCASKVGTYCDVEAGDCKPIPVGIADNKWLWMPVVILCSLVTLAAFLAQ